MNTFILLLVGMMKLINMENLYIPQMQKFAVKMIMEFQIGTILKMKRFAIHVNSNIL